jgi:YVTN family beta-propeller protein
VGCGGGNGVAVAPDGKHAYVSTGCGVTVIDTNTNEVVATVAVGCSGSGVAVAPDGKHAYVATACGVSVIDTAANLVVGTPIPVAAFPYAVVVTPDGKHVYVLSSYPSGTVSVIDTTTYEVTGTVTIPVGNSNLGCAITPDGKHLYVVNGSGGAGVLVIDTQTNKIAATVTSFPNFNGSLIGIAVAPDGKHAYVTEFYGSGFVIDTASNTVVATLPVATGSVAIGIVPPPPGVPFLAFNARLEIDIDHDQKKDAFAVETSFTLSSTASNGIHPPAEPVTLQIGTFSITIPPGSFRTHEHEGEGEDGHGHEDGFFSFQGVIDGVRLEALIKRTGTLRYAFNAKAKGANLTGTTNPVQVSLIIGDESGTTSVNATQLESLGLALK